MPTKVTLNTISGSYASTTQLNANFDTIENAFDNTLSRDGSTPNSMSANIDFNGLYTATNLRAPSNATDAVRLQDLQDASVTIGTTTATLTTITDSGGYFTSSSVEGALQEIGANLDPAIGGLTLDNFDAATVIDESDTIASNDNDTTFPTSAAVKDYVDTAVAAIGGGLVKQVVTYAYTGAGVSTSSTTVVTTDLTTSITPADNTNKVLIIVSMPVSCQAAASKRSLAYYELYRGTVAGTKLIKTVLGNYLETAPGTVNNSYHQLQFCYLDSPASASAVTYTVGFYRDAAETCTAQAHGGTGYTSTITLIEIEA